MPLYEFICPYCNTVEEHLWSGDDAPDCPKCYPMQEGVKMIRRPSAAGGYKMKGNNSASQTPRGSGSFKGRKRANS